MIRQILILSMVCVLSHTLSCPCYEDPNIPNPNDWCQIYRPPPKCCPSGELTPDPCGCCRECAKGTGYILDVLWCQPIKLIQVVSTSEFHEY